MSVLDLTAGRRATLAGALIALVLGALVGPVDAAAAHDELISTQPAADAVLSTAPTSVGLEFSADVLAISPTVVLAGPGGEVPLEAPSVDGTRVSVPVPADLAPGAYTVIWRVVSADGHPAQGTFAFSLAAPVAAATPTHATTTTPTATATATEVAPSATSTEQSAGSTSGVSGPAIAIGAGLLLLVIAAAVALARRRR